MKRETKKHECMKMSKKDLLQARQVTQELLCKTIREFGISMVMLILCLMFTGVLLPSVLNKVSFIVSLLFGMIFGIMIGALRAYNIFWEKTDFEKKQERTS